MFTFAAALALRARPGFSQVARTGRAIVGFPAGGTVDTVARLFVERMRAAGAGEFVVDNRPGAGGRLALEMLKTSPADGSAFAVSPSPMLTIYPHLYGRSLRYDPLGDFTPVSPVCRFPFGLAVAARHPAATLPEFIAWAKARPVMDWASPVPGSAPHFLGTELSRLAGIPMNHIPYRGAAPPMTDLLAGTIQAVILPLGEMTSFHRAGAARLLALSSAGRRPRLEEVPTFAEGGFPGLTREEMYGAFLPAGASEAVVGRLHAAIAEAAATPEIQSALARIDIDPAVMDPATVRQRIAGEMAGWGPIVAASGFRPDE